MVAGGYTRLPQQHFAAKRLTEQRNGAVQQKSNSAGNDSSKQLAASTFCSSCPAAGRGWCGCEHCRKVSPALSLLWDSSLGVTYHEGNKWNECFIHVPLILVVSSLATAPLLCFKARFQPSSFSLNNYLPHDTTEKGHLQKPKSSWPVVITRCTFSKRATIQQEEVCRKCHLWSSIFQKDSVWFPNATGRKKKSADGSIGGSKEVLCNSMALSL